MDELIDAISAYIEEIAQDIDDISDEEFEQIMSVLQQILQDAVESQQSGQGAQIPVDTDNLQGTPYPSSNINAFKYDPSKKQLVVKFMGKDQANAGPTYSYDNVPEHLVDVFARGAVGPKTTGKNKWHAWFKGRTPSHGAAMAALIKNGGYPYQRVA